MIKILKSPRIVLPVVTGVVLLGIWYGIKTIWSIHDFILPAPHQICLAFVNEWSTLMRATWVTFLGAGSGFLASVFVVKFRFSDAVIDIDCRDW